MAEQLGANTRPTHISDTTPRHESGADVTASESDPYVAGFRDCRCQVIAYLQQQHSAYHDDVTNDVILDDELLENLSQHLLDVEHRLHSSLPSTPSLWKRHLIESPRARTDGSCLDACAVGLPEVGTSLDDSALGNSFEVGAAEEMFVVDVQPETEVVSSLSENANVLMRLACENPQVGRLLDELFELMDSDDDDVIESDAESDEGVHEMNDELYITVTSLDDVCAT